MNKTKSKDFIEVIIEGGFSPKQYAHAYGFGYVWQMLTEEQRQQAVRELQEERGE